MAIVFKYKNPKNREYAPGFVNVGQDGQEGKQGSHGNSFFILDYELNNSYNIELTLQKIDKNLSLTSLDSSLNSLLAKRPYKEGDILMTSDKTCYKLIKSNTNSLFNNYKFDIKKLGSIRNSYKSNVKNIKIFDFTGTTIEYDWYINSQEIGKMTKTYSSTIKTCYPNHKNENAKADDNFYAKDSSMFTNNCVWLKFICEVDKINTDSSLIESKLSNNVYSLEMNLYNEKLIDNNSIPSETYTYEPSDSNISVNDLSKYKIPFYKKLEIPNLSTIKNKSYLDANDRYDDDLNALLFGECFNNPIIKDPNKNKSEVYYKKTPRCSTLCLDDFGLDSIHPSKNNIKCTLDNQRWMWLNQKATSYNDPFNDLYYNIDSSTFIDKDDNDVTVTHKIMKPFINEINGPAAGNTYVESKTILSFPYWPKSIIDGKKIDYFFEDSDNLGQRKWLSILDNNTSMINGFMGGFLKTTNSSDIQKEIDETYDLKTESINPNKLLLQFPTYELWNKNLTHNIINNKFTTYNNFGGNSLYFSSMKSNDDFHGNMLAFITNNKNIFNVYSTLSSTKETTMSNVTFELDSTYAYKHIKVSKDNNGKIHVNILD